MVSLTVSLHSIFHTVFSEYLNVFQSSLLGFKYYIIRMKSLILMFVFSLLYGGITPWQMFFRGRRSNGNLRIPFVSQLNLTREYWFNQKLDHFNPSNTNHWQQRYFLNDSFFDFKNGPVFLMIGGEAEANSKWVVNGTWLRYAERNNALCVLLEHRYYGKSHPVRNLSIKNMSYLSSEQALADIAAFISNYNEKLGRYAKWIVFGGSYAGSLAAWMRLKYPHLVTGAVSSSGPLLAVADFKDYYKVVEEALSSYDPNCVDAITRGTEQLSQLMTHRVGQQSLFKLFELCEPIDPKNRNDISNLYESLASNFAGIVQYNKDNRHDSDSAGLDIAIDTMCNIMKNTSAGNEIDRLAAVNSVLLKNSKEKCLDYKYENMIKEISSIDWSSKAAEGLRQWTYQTCTEFGFYQTSTLNITKKIFGDFFPFEFFDEQCQDIFGQKFNRILLDEGVEHTNTIYGGLDIRSDNIVFVQGSIDPWHVLGITKTLQKKSPAIYITGTAHCADMYPSSPEDLPQLKEARNQIEELIGSWLDIPVK